jgi:hypothetical protein
MGDFSTIKRCTAIVALQSEVMELPDIGLTSNTEEMRYRVHSSVLAKEVDDGYVRTVTSCNDLRSPTFLDKDMVKDVQE